MGTEEICVVKRFYFSSWWWLVTWYVHFEKGELNTYDLYTFLMYIILNKYI